VVWHRVAFHHVPRNEDQRHMHAHWDAFQIRPVNVSGSSPNELIDGHDDAHSQEGEPLTGADTHDGLSGESVAQSSGQSGGFFGSVGWFISILLASFVIRFGGLLRTKPPTG